VAEHLRDLFDGKVAIACTDCNYKERNKKMIRELLASLLKQLVQGRPAISQSQAL